MNATNEIFFARSVASFGVACCSTIIQIAKSIPNGTHFFIFKIILLQFFFVLVASKTVKLIQAQLSQGY